jgi:hypothetical protein
VSAQAPSFLRRATDNAIANWPLLALRLGESFLFVAVIVGAVLVTVVPIIAAGALGAISIENFDPEDLFASLTGPVLAAVALLVVVITVITIVLVALHSFVQAGVVGTYADGERAAGAAPPARDSYRVFSFERFFAWGRERWWPVFLVYNITWGVGLLVLLIPLVFVVGAIAIGAAGGEGAAILALCGGLALFFLFIVVVSVLTTLWSNAAIVSTVAHRLGAIAAVKRGFSITLRRFWRLLLAALVPFGVSFAFAILSMMISGGTELAGDAPALLMIFLPLRLALTLLQTALSLVAGLWFVSAVTAIVVPEGAD